MPRTKLEARQRSRELLDAMTPAQRDSWLLAGDNIVRAHRPTKFAIHLLESGIYVESPAAPDGGAS